MNKILISGYYGFNNAGDEAVLAGLIKALFSQVPQSEITITALSGSPLMTSAQHGINARDRYRELFSSIARSDLLLSGGGSLLQDVTSAHGIFYYLATVRIAQLLGRKTMFVAQGIGPLNRARSRNLTRFVANRLDAITVRDAASKDLLNSLGVTKTIHVTADPALLLQPTISRRQGGALLSVRQWPGLSQSFNQKLAAAIDTSGLMSRPESLNMHGLNDAEAADAVLSLSALRTAERNNEQYGQDYQSLLNKISGAEMVIGMRLHALIFAAAAGVPSIALSYDPKVTAFMKEIGQEDAVVDLSSATEQSLSAVFQNVWKSRALRSIHISNQVPLMRTRANSNATIALSLLGL
jgi:polysaccharide pyruvyl transferase CsaB